MVESKKNICDRVEKIFASTANFDESGFALYDLVTADVAHDLGHLSDADRKNLKKLGYKFEWFDREMTDGIIYRWVFGNEGHRKLSYILKLYFSPRHITDRVPD